MWLPLSSSSPWSFRPAQLGDGFVAGQPPSPYDEPSMWLGRRS
jgi:hypothetical protein